MSLPTITSPAKEAIRKIFTDTWTAKKRTAERRGLAASPEAVALAVAKRDFRRSSGGSHYATALEPVVANPLGTKDMGDQPLSAPWLTSAEHRGRKVRFREEFKAAKLTYSKKDLRQAASNRLHQVSRETLESGNDKWKWTEILCNYVAPKATKRALPKSGTGSNKHINNNSKYETHTFGPRDQVLDALSEALYSIAPINSLSRPRFSMGIQKAFGFDISNTEGASNVFELNLVKGLVDSWGHWSHMEDHVDTRDLLSAMNVVLVPCDDIRNHLIFSFGAYASSGALQRDQVTGKWYELRKLSKEDLQQMIVNLSGTMGTRALLKQMITEAWDRNPLLKATLAPGTGITRRSPKISLKGFKTMIETIPFDSLAMSKPSDPDKVVVVQENAIASYGKADIDAPPEQYLSRVERMYSPFLIQMLARERKKIHVHTKLLIFVLRWRMLAVAQIFEMWWHFTDKRMRARALMTEALTRWTTLTYRSGWNQLRNNVVRVSCAAEIARVYRGHYARSYVRWMRDAEASALYIQSMWRGRSRFLWFLRKMRRRDFGARTMQRYWRGHRGRQVAARVLLEFYRVKKKQIDQEKRRWRAEIRTRAATRIESVGRGWLGRQIGNQLRFDRDENTRIEEEMETYKTQQHRQTKLYEQKMVKAFKLKLLQEYETEEGNRKAKAWKRQIFMNQHLRALRKKIEANRILHADEMAENDAFWAAYDAEWDIKMNKKRAATRRQVLFDLGPNKGDTPEESKRMRETKVAVRTLSKEIRKESKNMGKILTQKQAASDAKEKIVLEKIEIALADTKERKQKKKDEIQAERDEEYDRTHSGERAAIADAKLTLVKKLQTLWIIYKARQLQKTLLQGLYVRELDVETMEFYYYNTRTYLAKWSKPLLLSEELHKPNKWYKCRDPNSVAFFYWPGPDKGERVRPGHRLGEVMYERPVDYYSEGEGQGEGEGEYEEE
jgi:hypothetical protein